jgi:SAM-dependent methyltransferase
MDPMPEPAFLKTGVYSPSAGYQIDLPQDLSAAPAPSWWQRVLDDVERFSSGKRLLDVGCSNGGFLRYAQSRGFVGCGVELNPFTAEIARRNGLDVKTGTLDDAGFKEGSFDIVWLGDVIEHVPNPGELLRSCAYLLLPGGILAISTPNLDCNWARTTLALHRWFGIPSSSVTPPHHTVQFSETNFRLLLASAGFSIEKIWFRRPPSLLYELGSTHLLGRFRRERRIGTMVALLFGFSAYVILFNANRLISIFSRKDFSMLVIARPVGRVAPQQ